MTQGTGDLPDEDCYWHSTAIGPMLVEKTGDHWHLWRRITGGSNVTCGVFYLYQNAMRMANLLAVLPDEAFT